MAPSEGHSADASTTATTSPSKLRHRTRILAAQNDTAHPRIDNILASKEQEHSDSSTIHPREEHQPEAKAVSTARPTSPLMPIVRSLERLSEKVPSLPKLPASNIEVNSMPIFWPLIGPYLVWIFFFDKAPGRGGRTSMWFRRWRVWEHFAGYYPVSVIKEADLPPDRPYVFGYHPHGIIGTGAFANFATDSTGFSTLFPGIKTHLLTLTSNFKIPFYRELLLWLGLCSVSKKSCANILRQGPGSAITIVVGGAAESLAAHPGTNDLTLRKRLGFIKIAVREGANNRGTTVYKIQKQFQKLFGFTLPLFHGRGLFNYNLGLMPFRHPIVSVVGRPIHVKKNVDPPVALLEEYQKEYIEELMRIWEAYKDIYARNRTRELRLVE
ncbi:hypothetical protein QFC20_003961 [Naganishia adeliensis]|uniref:Uncharacterized protein n=1 Tax=Naganishia adeliensis TaxID=92952 RepID=A0ACC2W588_9TREE|nr:hypothetical protein QFC20_003961 [Naganishia adeliensis]